MLTRFTHAKIRWEFAASKKLRHDGFAELPYPPAAMRVPSPRAAFQNRWLFANPRNYELMTHFAEFGGSGFRNNPFEASSAFTRQGCSRGCSCLSEKTRGTRVGRSRAKKGRIRTRGSSVSAKVGITACPRNLSTTVSCDSVNCPIFSTRSREGRWQPPHVPSSPLMGGRVVSLSVVL